MKAATLFIFIQFMMMINQLEADKKPPKEPPPSMMASYTRNDTIPMEFFFVDDTDEGKGSHYKFPSETVGRYIAGVNATFSKLTLMVERVENLGIPQNLYLSKFPKEQWLYVSLILKEFNFAEKVKDGKALVIGSTEPWIESLAVLLGASAVYTQEYNNLTYTHEKMVTVAERDFPTFHACDGDHFNSFDAAFTMSSLDHDGLGRYGDPLNPDGDLEAIAKIADLLKPDGLLFLTVPIGPDVVVFNLHRRYGNVRLPLLLDGWDVVGRVGWDEQRVTAPANWRQTYEPIFVLRKSSGYTSRRCGRDELRSRVPTAGDNAEVGEGVSHEGVRGVISNPSRDEEL